MTREEKKRLLAEIEKQYKWLMTKSPTIYMMDIAFDAIRKAVRDEASKAPEQESRKGHWIEEFNDLEGEVRFTCSSCGKYQMFGTDFCYHCGSDNREVEG